jgi:hypothetical protein
MAGAVLVYSLAERLVTRFEHPGVLFFSTWVTVEIIIAASVSLTGNLRMDSSASLAGDATVAWIHAEHRVHRVTCRASAPWRGDVVLVLAQAVTQLMRDERGVWFVRQMVVVLGGSQELRRDEARLRIDVLRRDVDERGSDL